MRSTGVRAQVLLLVLLTVAPVVAMADAIPVHLLQTEQGWQLLRGGEPYLIRGAGGDTSLELLAKAGGNSIRTWDADDIDDRTLVRQAPDKSCTDRNATGAGGSVTGQAG